MKNSLCFSTCWRVSQQQTAFFKVFASAAASGFSMSAFQVNCPHLIFCRKCAQRRQCGPRTPGVIRTNRIMQQNGKIESRGRKHIKTVWTSSIGTSSGETAGGGKRKKKEKKTNCAEHGRSLLQCVWAIKQTHQPSAGVSSLNFTHSSDWRWGFVLHQFLCPFYKKGCKSSVLPTRSHTWTWEGLSVGGRWRVLE